MSSYVLEGQAPSKSRRPGRWVGVAALLTSLAALSAVARYVSWANHLPPLRAESRVYPEPNGLDCFLAVSWKLPPRLTPRDPLRADTAALRPLVNANHGHLLKLREAVALPFVTPLVRSQYRVPTYDGDVSSAGWLFVAKARTELDDGRAAAAMSWALDATELGIRVGRGAPIPFLRPAWECGAWGTGVAEQCVPQLTETEAAAAGRRIDRLLLQLPPFSEIADEERRFRVARMHEALTRGVPSGMRSTAPSPLALWGARLGAIWAPKPVRFAAVERDYATLATYAQKSWPERHRATLSVQPSARASIDQAGDASADREARLRLLRLELALQSHHRRTGAYPASLGELAGLLDASARQDPFATGPLRYQRTPTGYRLYSCGRDGADHGGDPTRDLLAGTLANWR